jgi:hypothetical protein
MNTSTKLVLMLDGGVKWCATKEGQESYYRTGQDSSARTTRNVPLSGN